MNNSQRGSILMLVTWVLAILGMIATFLIYRAEAEWAALYHTESNLRLRQTAEQVFYEHLAVLLADDKENDTSEDDWFGKTGRFVSEREGYAITVLVEDEGSKPNLNLMNGYALRQLVPDKELAVNPVLDWCDTDQIELENGAEAPYYNSLQPAYKPRDGFFSSLQEILAVKGGRELYPYLAPELTVFGKVNLNVLTPDQFQFILAAAGFDKYKRENIVADFQEKLVNAKGTKDYRPVNGMNDLEWLSFGAGESRKLQPFLRFTGSSNVNLMSLKGLEALLAATGISATQAATKAREIVEYIHKTKPIESLDELAMKLGKECTNRFEVKHYFTLASSIIRYRVWVVKGGRRCFLNTVQERVAGDLQVKWRVRTLSWQVLTNQKAPEIPEQTPFEATLNPEPEPINSLSIF